MLKEESIKIPILRYKLTQLNLDHVSIAKVIIGVKIVAENRRLVTSVAEKVIFKNSVTESHLTKIQMMTEEILEDNKIRDPPQDLHIRKLHQNTTEINSKRKKE
jgi:hypothetical protein